jgi:hypothetical protein
MAVRRFGQGQHYLYLYLYVLSMINAIQAKHVPGIAAIHMCLQAYYLALQSCAPVRNYCELKPSYTRQNTRSYVFCVDLRTNSDYFPILH